MKICKLRAAWTFAAVIATLLAGAPVIADDTELLLINPQASAAANKPNILLILDTSGSMGGSVSTTEPYDNSITYSGGCDNNRMYWTDVNIVPACDPTNVRFIEKASFQCVAGDAQIAGIGSYTDTMVQHWSSAFLGGGPLSFLLPFAESWMPLLVTDNVDPVECLSDSGIHGGGVPGEVYANVFGTAPFTADPNAELAWGSSPATISYTVYDGNYLNWRENPVTVSLPKIDIVKSVTTAVLNSIENVNVGVMRFNNSEGGPVIQAMTDLDTDRASILNTIDSLTDDGATPLAEVLYEAALYWDGLPAHYGELINEHATDPNALVSSNPEVYLQPTANACTKNFNVLLSDGQPNNEEDAPGLVPTLPDYSTILGRSDCSGSGDGHCLDDVAEYLFKHDFDPSIGNQVVTTHTIGFAQNIAVLEDTANVSDGSYFQADDVESLTTVLLQIIADITDRSMSFSAPSVAVNTFNRTQNLNDLYLTVFSAKAKVHWPGNLKKYKLMSQMIVDANDVGAVDPATGFFFDTTESIWSGLTDGNDVKKGGAANQLPDPSLRNLYTNNGSSDLSTSSNHVSQSNAGAFTLADFGLTGAAGEPTKADIIDWARGVDVRDEDFDPATTVRYAMGDPLHSQPASVIYGGTPANPDVVVFVATNDGYLHAINGTTGAELWSFMPKELMPNLGRLFFDPDAQFKHYGIDGNIVPVVTDNNHNGIVDGADFVYILFGMRRGGGSYYALDVTNKNAPELKWVSQNAAFGQTWSTPVAARVDISGGGLSAENAVVILGAGYDSAHDTASHPTSPDGQGAGILMLNLESGNEVWRAGSDGSADLQLSAMTRAIPNQVRVVDLTGDGFADRMYASDLGGQIWRFDIFNGQSAANLVTGGVIARLGAEGIAAPAIAETRRFYTSPDVSIFDDHLQEQRFISVSIGSGYRAHPLDNRNEDRFFSVRDPDVFTKLSQIEYDTYDIATDGDLIEVSGTHSVVVGPTDRGWKFTMPSNQKVLSSSITFDNTVFFVGFSPDTSAAAACLAGQGQNFLYKVSVINGDPIVNNLDTLDPADADNERVHTLQQGGIAPAPTILFPSPDDPNCTGENCSPPPIYCVGVECGPPGFDNNPVRTLWTQDGIQ